LEKARRHRAKELIELLELAILGLIQHQVVRPDAFVNTRDRRAGQVHVVEIHFDGRVIPAGDQVVELFVIEFFVFFMHRFEDRIDDRLRESIEEMLLAVLSRDVSMLATLIKRVGRTPPRLDDSLLSIDVADMVANYGSQSLENFDLAGALNDMTDIMHRHQISLPPQTSLLIKMLVTLEGTLHQLAPKFSLIEVMQPFFRRMWIRRLSPKRQAKRFRRVYFELEALLETLPGQISSVMQLIQEGRLDVHLAHKGLSPSVNRLVLGILISSVFLGSSMLLAFKVPPLLFMEPVWFGVERLSLFGLLGYALSMMVGLRLVMAINRSGHLDQRDSD